MFIGICSSVLLTDGHPKCVFNQNICIQMNEQEYEQDFLSREKEKRNGKREEKEKHFQNIETKLNESFVRSSHNVRSKLLRWSEGDENGDLKNIFCCEASSSFSTSCNPASFFSSTSSPFSSSLSSSPFTSSSSLSLSSSSSSSSSSSTLSTRNKPNDNNNDINNHKNNVNNKMFDINTRKDNENIIIDVINNAALKEIKNENEEKLIIFDFDKIIIEKNKKFDIIIAADCLFFKDFHKDLIWLLSNSLKKNGFIFLLQPNRGNTMKLFLEKIKISLLFRIVYVKNDYNDEVRV